MPTYWQRTLSFGFLRRASPRPLYSAAAAGWFINRIQSWKVDWGRVFTHAPGFLLVVCSTDHIAVGEIDSRKSFCLNTRMFADRWHQVTLGVLTQSEHLAVMEIQP